MKSFILVTFILGLSGYFITSYFSQNEMKSDDKKSHTVSNKDLLKNKNLHNAFEQIMKKENSEVHRVPATEDVNAQHERDHDNEMIVQTSHDEILDTEEEDVEYDNGELTEEILVAEIQDYELKIKFHRARREEKEANRLERKLLKRQRHLQYFHEIIQSNE